MESRSSCCRVTSTSTCRATYGSSSSSTGTSTSSCSTTGSSTCCRNRGGRGRPPILIERKQTKKVEVMPRLFLYPFHPPHPTYTKDCHPGLDPGPRDNPSHPTYTKGRHPGLDPGPRNDPSHPPLKKKHRPSPSFVIPGSTRDLATTRHTCPSPEAPPHLSKKNYLLEGPGLQKEGNVTLELLIDDARGDKVVAVICAV